MDTCPRCRMPYSERPLPRRLRSQRDREYVRQAGWRLVGEEGREKAVWVARVDCACGWTKRLRAVPDDLLPLLLPDPVVEREQRRRAGLERHIRAERAA